MILNSIHIRTLRPKRHLYANGRATGSNLVSIDSISILEFANSQVEQPFENSMNPPRAIGFNAFRLPTLGADLIRAVWRS